MSDINHDFMNFGKPDNNAGTHSNESDDFEQLDPYGVQESQPDDNDFLTTSSTHGNADFASLGSQVAGLHSTDRPLVTFEDTPPSAPPAPPSLSPVPETPKLDEMEPEFERRYSQPSPTKISPSRYEPEPADIIPVDKHEFSIAKPSDLTALRKEEKHDFQNDPHNREEEEDDEDEEVIVKSSPEKKKESPVKATPAPPKMEAVPAVENTQSTPENDDESLPCACPISAWFNPQNLDPRVVELIYWRDPKKSGVVFGSILSILLSLTYFSLITVVAYLSLVVLAGTLAFRIYKNVLAAVQKSNEGHPFKQYLDQELVITNEQIQEITQTVVVHLNAVAHELRRLILVEDLVDSIKFGVMMWCLTYVGAWFNGMTLLILAFVAAFTLPKVYETNKTQIDHYVGIVHTQVSDIMSKIKAKVPIGKKPKEQ